MARSVTEYQILIASPSDVAEARQAAREAVLKWNELYSSQRRVLLNPIMWETHAAPEMGERAQSIINRQLVDDCDVVVGIFWTRLGTPSGQEKSGTVEELERLIANGKKAAIYFCTASVDPYRFDDQEFARVRLYREECEPRGLLWTFSTPDDLRNQLVRHLSKYVDELDDASGGEATIPAPREVSDDQQPSSAVLVPKALEKGREQSEPRQWFPLMRAGKYDEGMTILREAFERGEWTHGSLTDMEAFGRLIAYEDGGQYQAFVDLEHTAFEDRSNADLWFWYGVALNHADRRDEAFEAMRHVMNTAESGAAHRWAVNWIAVTQFQAGQEAAALSLWRDELANERDPHGRAQYIARLADMYELVGQQQNLVRATSLRELVLELHPADLKARLTLAWQYGNDLNSAALSIVHYLDALSRDDQNGNATINAGWFSEKLSLPITAMQYYRTAAALGEPLAATNMGWRFLEAGFAPEAEALVAEARRLDADSEAADKLAVAIRERKEDEANRWNATTEKTSNVRLSRISFAKAFVSRSLDLTSITGIYSGNPSTLQIAVDNVGNVSGTFQYAGSAQQFLLTGTVEGKSIPFTWKSVKHATATITTLLTGTVDSAGVGALVITEGGLLGFSVRGTEVIDPSGLDTFTEWKLQRVSGAAENVRVT